MPGAVNKNLRQTRLCIYLITILFDKINAVCHLSAMKCFLSLCAKCRSLLKITSLKGGH